MTRAVIILLLVSALSFAARSFLPADATITGSGGALAFGFILLATIQCGHIFGALKQPQLTGFLLCGALFGPQILGLLTPAMIHDLGMVKKVSVGLIALTAGCELNFKNLVPKLRTIGLVSFFGLVCSGIGIFVFLFGVSRWLPFMQDMTPVQRGVVALVCTNVLLALSPAVVMGILSETRAEGPLSELALSIAVVADLIIAISFTLSDSMARSTFAQEAVPGSIGGALALHILGSLAVGLVVGAVLALYIRRVALRVGLFVFVTCFVVAEAGSALHLDPLLLCLAAGLFLENISPVSGHEVIRETAVAAMPTFAIFFGVIGAELDLRAFITVAPFAIGAAAARGMGLYAGARAGGWLSKLDPRVTRGLVRGMLPQAGIAIALANLLSESFRPWGAGAATLLLGTVLVNQLVGPVVFRRALASLGEIGRRGEEGLVARPSHTSIPPAAVELHRASSAEP